jgi:hypothetical protein
MDETYRMLGREHNAQLAREAAAAQRRAELERAGGVTRAEAVEQPAEPIRANRVRTALRRLVPARSV